MRVTPSLLCPRDAAGSANPVLEVPRDPPFSFSLPGTDAENIP